MSPRRRARHDRYSCGRRRSGSVVRQGPQTEAPGTGATQRGKVEITVPESSPTSVLPERKKDGTPDCRRSAYGG